MTLLWLIGGSLQSMQYLQDLEDERPPRFAFVNRSDVHRHRMRIEGEYAHHAEAVREPLAFSGMPTPVFRVGDPAFALDYFDAGVACASPRLRRALALCGDSVVKQAGIVDLVFQDVVSERARHEVVLRR